MGRCLTTARYRLPFMDHAVNSSSMAESVDSISVSRFSGSTLRRFSLWAARFLSLHALDASRDLMPSLIVLAKIGKCRAQAFFP